MVSSATQVSYCLTAAVWDFPSTGLWRFDPLAVSPVCVVVAPTALELHAQRAKAEPGSTATSSFLQPPTPSPGLHSLLQKDSSYLMGFFIGVFLGYYNYCCVLV